MSLDLSSLENAIVQLREVLDLCDSEVARDNPMYGKHWRTAAVKSFEYTYELSLKMLGRHMELASHSPTEIKQMSFSGMIREAYGKGLVRSDLAFWRAYRKSRGTTSHTYNESKAQEILEDIPDFLDEARYLLSRLQEKNSQID